MLGGPKSCPSLALLACLACLAAPAQAIAEAATECEAATMRVTFVAYDALTLVGDMPVPEAIEFLIEDPVAAMKAAARYAALPEAPVKMLKLFSQYVLEFRALDCGDEPA